MEKGCDTSAQCQIAYGYGFQLAWSRREEGSKDPVGFFVTVLAILGFAIGSFAQPLWDKGAECLAAGQALVKCMFLQRP
jgi:hypothetical protein